MDVSQTSIQIFPMKKFIGLLALFLSGILTGTAKAQMVDTFSLSTVTEAGYTVPVLDPSDYTQVGIAGDLTAKGNGTSISFSGLIREAETNSQLTFTNPGYIRNTDCKGGYIQKITGVDKVYFSENTPLTHTNFYSAGTYAYNDSEDVIIPEKAARYFYVDGSPWLTFNEIQVEWGDEPVVGIVKNPIIYTNSRDEITSGTIVSIECPTQNATLHITVKSSDGTEINTDKKGIYKYTITGEEGTVWTFSVYATKDGLVDSENITQTFTIELPSLKNLVVNCPIDSQGETIMLGGDIVLTNPNSVGTINYTINNASTVTTSDKTVTVKAEGKLGDKFKMEAWISAEGYKTSPIYSIDAVLTSKVALDPPTISPDGGTIVAGTQVVIIGDERGEGISYSINGEPWVNEELYFEKKLSLSITEECTLEVRSWAGDDNESSFSDSKIISADFSIERLSSNELAITPTLLDAGQRMKSYYESTDFGEIEYKGYVIDGSMYFNDAYEGPSYITKMNEYLRNTSATQVIGAIRADLTAGGVAVYLSYEPIEVESDCFSNRKNNFVAIGDISNLFISPSVKGRSGEWIELYDIPGYNNHKYFFVRGLDNNFDGTTEGQMMTSFLVRYGEKTSIDSIEVTTEEDAHYYNLNGIEVSSESLTPGLYIRKIGSKSEKIIIK